MKPSSLEASCGCAAVSSRRSVVLSCQRLCGARDNVLTSHRIVIEVNVDGAERWEGSNNVGCNPSGSRSARINPASRSSRTEGSGLLLASRTSLKARACSGEQGQRASSSRLQRENTMKKQNISKDQFPCLS
jgi:hypothetical protein